MDSKQIKEDAIKWNADNKCGICGKTLSPRHYILYLEDTPIHVCTMCKRLHNEMLKKEEK